MKTPLDDYNKPMTRLERTTMENYHHIEVPNKGKESKPIIFHALGNMDNHSDLVEDNKKKPEEPIFSLKVQ